MNRTGTALQGLQRARRSTKLVWPRLTLIPPYDTEVIGEGEMRLNPLPELSFSSVPEECREWSRRSDPVCDNGEKLLMIGVEIANAFGKLLGRHRIAVHTPAESGLVYRDPLDAGCII